MGIDVLESLLHLQSMSKTNILEPDSVLDKDIFEQ
jgi:hypothetical protein